MRAKLISIFGLFLSVFMIQGSIAQEDYPIYSIYDLKVDAIDKTAQRARNTGLTKAQDQALKALFNKHSHKCSVCYL